MHTFYVSECAYHNCRDAHVFVLSLTEYVATSKSRVRRLLQLNAVMDGGGKDI